MRHVGSDASSYGTSSSSTKALNAACGGATGARPKQPGNEAIGGPRLSGAFGAQHLDEMDDADSADYDEDDFVDEYGIEAADPRNSGDLWDKVMDSAAAAAAALRNRAAMVDYKESNGVMPSNYVGDAIRGDALNACGNDDRCADPIERPVSRAQRGPHFGNSEIRPAVRSGSISSAPTSEDRLGGNAAACGNSRGSGERHVPPQRISGARSASASFAGGRKRSDTSLAEGQPKEEADSRCQDGQDNVQFRVYGATSWHDTLAQFPSLVRLYPLATANEAEAPEDMEESHRGSECGESPNPCGDVGEDGRTSMQFPVQDDGDCRHPSTATCQDHMGHEEQQVRRAPPVDGCATPPRTPPRPRSASSRGTSSRGAQQRQAFVAGGHPVPWSNPAPSEGWWSADDVAAAWHEVEQAQQSLVLRERELAQRESAVQRAEARNDATGRQLDELRQRLDEYGRELEEGIVALTKQQSALREERCHVAQVQARARRACAAAVRDDVVASRIRVQDDTPWKLFSKG
mmetsp:Transcript_58347/g.162617  ORF Transcript_58347/g.162617 Transcript_58347/m.162617 type:complete len:519 (-) Transcript_58347:95-1651(-)